MKTPVIKLVTSNQGSKPRLSKEAIELARDIFELPPEQCDILKSLVKRLHAERHKKQA